eukprot:644871-Amphidinium_carterae.2
MLKHHDFRTRARQSKGYVLHTHRCDTKLCYPVTQPITVTGVGGKKAHSILSDNRVALRVDAVIGNIVVEVVAWRDGQNQVRATRNEGKRLWKRHLCPA